MSRQGLKEEQFKVLEPPIDSRNPYGRKLAPWRPVVNTIFRVLCTRASWKDPKEVYSSFNSTCMAWKNASRWFFRSIFKRVALRLQNNEVY